MVDRSGASRQSKCRIARKGSVQVSPPGIRNQGIPGALDFICKTRSYTTLSPDRSLNWSLSRSENTAERSAGLSLKVKKGDDTALQMMRKPMTAWNARNRLGFENVAKEKAIPNN